MARGRDSRSPSPTGSYSSSRRSRREDERPSRDKKDDGRPPKRRSRSPSPHVVYQPGTGGNSTANAKPAQRNHRDRGRDRDYYRRDERRSDRRDDRPSRRDRSRERHRSPEKPGKDRRHRSRERDVKDRRDDARENHKRRRDDSADSRASKSRREEGREPPNGRASNSKRPQSPNPSTRAKQTEDDKKAERLAKLEQWKQKQAVERQRKQEELEASSGARNILSEMDKKAAESSATTSPRSPGTPQDGASPRPYAGKFDPKEIAKRAAAASATATKLGGDVAVPIGATVSGILADQKKVNGVPQSTGTSNLSSIKASGNVSGFGFGSRIANEADKAPNRRGIDFDDEDAGPKKLEKLPQLPLDQTVDDEDAAQANGDEEDEDDVDDDLENADTEEAAAAAARAAAEKREERLQAQNAEQGERRGDGDATNVPASTAQDVDMADTPAANTHAQEPAAEEEEVDPLDVFMSELQNQNTQKAPGVSRTANPTKAKQQEPEAMFGDDDDEFTTMEANPDEILEMASKARKKKDIPKVDHAKINYEPFRKSFYTEPSELTSMTEEELADLRLELDGIKVRGVDVPKPVQKWSQFGLGVSSLGVIQRLGFEKPTAIQCQAIPAIMSGRDLIGIAKTGSGKTIAFLLPMFRHIKDQRPLEAMDGPIGLIMTPTRELATQIHKECKPWLKALNLRAVCAYGGAPIKDQIAELKRGAEIVVCTPGRMIDLLAANSGRAVNFRRVTYCVLDEADRMFDMGFEPQVMRILGNVRPDKQSLLFSATFPRNMEALARKTLTKPVEIVIGGRSVVAPEIKQIVEVRSEETKFVRLLQLLGELYENPAADAEGWTTLIFVDRQEGAEELMNAIMRKGYPTNTLHGGKDQYDRDSVISDFKAGVFPVLVATSVAARGLDVKQLKMVVNYDCPNHLEDYVHRCGRTGRAGLSGTAVTFITEEQQKYSVDLAKALKQSGQEVPEDLQKLVEAFMEKVKSGKEKASGSGFGGKGLERLDQERESARNRERRLFGTGEEGEEEEKDKKKEKERVKEEKLEEIVVKATNAPPPQPTGIPEGIDLDGPVKVHRTELPAGTSTDRMKGVSDAVAAINARLRKSGDIRGNAPIDNKGPDAGAFHATLEINDFPQKARWAVTNRTNVAKILEATGTSITTKGNFYAQGSVPGPNDMPKLYILVEGDTEVVVQMAMKELMRLLKEGTTAAMDSEARAPVSGRYNVL